MVVLNAAAQVTSLMATLVIQTVYLIIVARVLGPEDFGRFSFAWSVVQMLLIGGDFGLHNTALRLIASARDRSREISDLFLGLKLGVGLLVLAVVAVLSGTLTLGGGGEIALLIFGAGAALQCFSTGLNVVFQAHGRLYFASLNIFLIFVFQAVLGLLFLLGGGRLQALAFAYALSCVIATILNLVLFHRSLHGFRPRLQGAWEFVRRSLAVGLGTLFNSVSSRITISLLTFIAGPFGAGIYSAAVRLPQSLSNLPQGIFSAVLPVMAAADPGSSTLRHIFRRTLLLMVMLSVPLAGFLFLAAPWLVALIYGEQYQAAVPVVRILAWALVPMFVGMAFSHVLLSRQNLVKHLPWTAAAGLAAQLGLGFLLIPSGGSLGGAWAFLLAETILAAAYAAAAWRTVASPLEVPPLPVRGTCPRIGVVVQRFGEGIIGGAEAAARGIATRLSRWYEVEVLTTCSRDHRNWNNDEPAGTSEDGPLLVRRFETVQGRSWRVFGLMSAVLFRLAARIRLPAWLEMLWVKQQGPFCPDLIRFLAARGQDYDALLFWTVLYYPTVAGLPIVRDRAILVPTAHDEPALRLSIYRGVLQAPAALVFQSDFEREFVHTRFANAHLPWSVAGVGVELGTASGEEDWLLYLGRIEAGKGCLELFDAVLKDALPLVAAGPSLVPIPGHVRYEGEVTEPRKRELLARCRAVVVPSRMESLSILALEGWAFGKPVLARAGTVVARMIEESDGGCVFSGWQDFPQAVAALRPEMGARGRDYVAARFSWEQVVEKYRDMIEVVLAGRH